MHAVKINNSLKMGTEKDSETHTMAGNSVLKVHLVIRSIEMNAINFEGVFVVCSLFCVD